MNARAYSIAAVHEAPARVRDAAPAMRREATDLYPALGILTGIGISLLFWVLLAMAVI